MSQRWEKECDDRHLDLTAKNLQVRTDDGGLNDIGRAIEILTARIRKLEEARK